MANKILVNPYPYGIDVTQRGIVLTGSVALCGSAVATGEPLYWNALNSGIGYNEINFAGNGAHGNGSALTTGFAVSTGVCTVTAANNFAAGQTVSFVGNTQTLSALFNGVNVQIVSATASAFTFNTALTGTTTTGDVGLAFNVSKVLVPALCGPNLTATVTAISASGSVLTVTAANAFLPGAAVTVNVATGTLGPKLAGLSLPVIQSTSTAFTATMPSALTGTTGTGTAVGNNCVQPYSVALWSAGASGYTYSYSETTGVLFVQQVPASSALASAAPMVNIPAAAYPAGVLADVVKFEARFLKDR